MHDARTRTVISIAHRLSAVRHADQFVVLDEGLHCAIGTHGALLAAGGRYSRLATIG